MTLHLLWDYSKLTVYCLIITIKGK
jgi:hypothetical protein